MSAAICYPMSFLERPEDRSLLGELGSAGVSAEVARLTLYLIWKDFATGGGDRRKIAEGQLAGDRQVRVLESYCGWKGGEGELVRMAIDSGFLSLGTEGEDRFLVCTGFFPLNSAFSGKGTGFQRRGGLTRALRSQDKRAGEEAKKHNDLLSRSSVPGFSDVPAEDREQALTFIHRVCRARAINVPSDGLLAGGVFRMAVECARATSPEDAQNTLIWILSKRNSPDLSNRLDALLREWPTLVKRAAEEMG